MSISNPFHFPNVLYHATLLRHYDSIKNRILIHREDAKIDLDFGKGFYTTTNLQQANERAQFLQNKETDWRTGALKRENRGIVVEIELNIELMYNMSEEECKVYESATPDWAEYIVYNRILRRPDHIHKYKWTYGLMADGRALGFLCRQYYKKEISIDQLLNGYECEGEFVQGIAPYSNDYVQLSFHEDENFTNQALHVLGFTVCNQPHLAQRR